ncbi:MAG: hypothetical protein ACPL1G_03500 [Thermodesulfovibrionales bacterium]
MLIKQIRCNIKMNLLIIVFISLCYFFSCSELFAGGIVKRDGMLTSIEKDGSLIVDEQGYLVSTSVKVLNYEGKRISLRSIKLPAKIYFHFEYTKKGPVINLIKVYPDVIPK